MAPSEISVKIILVKVSAALLEKYFITGEESPRFVVADGIPPGYRLFNITPERYLGAPGDVFEFWFAPGKRDENEKDASIVEGKVVVLKSLREGEGG